MRLRFVPYAMIFAAVLAPPLSAHAGVLGSDVDAKDCAAAVGGSVINSQMTVNCGIPLEKVEALIAARTKPLEDLNAAQKDTNEQLKKILGLNEAQLRSALKTLGEKDVPAELLIPKLVEIALHYRDLAANAASQSGDDPAIAALKSKVLAAIKAGDRDLADRLLVEIDAKQSEILGRVASAVAETRAQRGRLALAGLHYADAAKRFAEAAKALPQESAFAMQRIGYLVSEVDAWYKQGDEFGDNDALRLAIDRYRIIIGFYSRYTAPLEWAATQHALGDALRTLGEREQGPARLEEAVQAYREALEVRTRDQVPLDWAQTQSNLGNALKALGERESGTTRLDEAVQAYREALEVRTRDRAPLDWAQTQNNLGTALEEWTRDRVPLKWATTQNNLGVALERLGERESGTARLEQAVMAYRAALEEWTRQRVPLEWATTQNNLGIALQALGERESDTVRLEESANAYRAALERFTREQVPLKWAVTQNNLGATLERLGERESGTARLQEAVNTYRAALEERTRDHVPLDWAQTQNNLGVALATLGERESGTARLEEAVAAWNACLEVAKTVWPLEWVQSVRTNVEKTQAEINRRTASAPAASPAGPVQTPQK